MSLSVEADLSAGLLSRLEALGGQGLNADVDLEPSSLIFRKDSASIQIESSLAFALGRTIWMRPEPCEFGDEMAPFRAELPVLLRLATLFCTITGFTT